MAATESKQNPGFLEYVYKLNEGVDLMTALDMSLRDLTELDVSQLERIGFSTYDPGKWTVHQILQHLIDWERIWCFRAIIFARDEGRTPDAHDQERMGNNSNANERSIKELVNEMRTLRQSTIMMFESFNDEILQTNCRFFEYEMPLYSIGLTITAHQIHHFKVIEDKYLPLNKKMVN